MQAILNEIGKSIGVEGDLIDSESICRATSRENVVDVQGAAEYLGVAPHTMRNGAIPVVRHPISKDRCSRKTTSKRPEGPGRRPDAAGKARSFVAPKASRIFRASHLESRIEVG